MMQAEGVAVKDRTSEIIRMHGGAPGPHMLALTLLDSNSVVLGLKVKDAGTGSTRKVTSDQDTLKSSQDTGYDGDGTTTSFSGQSLSTPVIPKSVVIPSSAGAPELQDEDGDGILYAQSVAARAYGSGGTFASMASESFTVTFDGITEHTVTFGTEATIAAAVAIVNGFIGEDGTCAAIDANNIYIASAKTGKDSSVKISAMDSTVGTKLGLSEGTFTNAMGTVNYSTGALAMTYANGYAPSPGGSADPATLTGSIAGTTFNFDAGDTLSVDINNLGAATATFDAAAATASGRGGTFVASSSESMIYAVDGGEQKTATLGAGTETTLATYVNKLNTILEGCHAVANSNSLGAIIGVLNEVKTDYEAHRIDVTSHTNADSSNDIAAADASDQATAETLANELKTDFNLHMVALSEAEEAITLVNDIAAQYEAHIAETTMLEEAITLVNELAANYELHRVKQPAVHSVANTTDLVTVTNPATNLAETIALANELKSIYNNHRTDVNEAAHPTDDDTNVVTAGDAVGIADLPALLSDIFVQFNAHVASGTFHVGADNAVIATSDAMGTAAVHWVENTTDVVSATNPSTDLAEAILLANDLKGIYNNHRTDANEDSHGTDDDTNVITAADATTLDTLTTLLIELTADYAAHIANTGGAFHVNADATNVVTADAVQTSAVHEQDDGTNTIASPAASDLASLLTLVTELKTNFNSHRTQANVHDANDVTNVVARTFDAIDLVSDSKGTAASIQIVSGDAAFLEKTGLRAGTSTGTGDVANIDAVTHAEIKSVIEDDVKTAVAGDLVTVSQTSDNKVKLTTVATGVSAEIDVAASNVATALGLSLTATVGVASTADPVNITCEYLQGSSKSGPGRYVYTIPNLPEGSELIVEALAVGGACRVRAQLEEIRSA